MSESPSPATSAAPAPALVPAPVALPAPAAPAPAAPSNPNGLVGAALEKLLGRNYRTTIAGGTALACGVVVALSAAVPGLLPVHLVAIATALGPIVGGAGLIVAKDARVSGLPK